MRMPGWALECALGSALALGLHFLWVAYRVRPLRRRAWMGLAAAAAAILLPAAWPGSPIPFVPALALATAAGALLSAHRYLALHVADREAMRALSRAYADLQASVRMRELGASAASISHEIRNYAATLQGNAALLERGLGGEGRRGELERIRAAAERMETISRDISAFAGSAAPLRLEPLDLEAVIRGCLDGRFAGRPAVIRRSGPALARGDAPRLEQAFLNFFRNSWEAGASRLEVRLTAWGDKVVVALEDDGRGCPPGDLERLAAPFFTRKEPGGTGLGCSIAESILKAHGATLRAYSKNALGGGRRGLILNLVFPAEGAAAEYGRELPVAAGKGPARENLVRPMFHLGLRPTFLDPGESAGAAQGRLLFLDAESAERMRGRPGPASVVVGERREAVRLPGGETFLFSEEALVGLLREGARP